MTVRRYRELLAGLAAVGAYVAVMGGIGAGGWPGAGAACILEGGCDCEAVGGGLVAQPANTASGLGFILVGLAILGMIGRARGRDGSARGATPTVTPAFAATYGAVTLLLGFGSMAMHASVREWGGWLDLASIYTYVLLILTHNVGVLYQWPFRRFLVTLVVSSAALSVTQLPIDNGLGKYLLGGLILVTIASEAALTGRLGRFSRAPRDRRWLWAGLITYGSGNVIWLLSRSGGALCKPDSLLQGHALWHVTAAATVALLFLYLARSPGVPTRRNAAAR